jgi:hypothetical protein
LKPEGIIAHMEVSMTTDEFYAIQQPKTLRTPDNKGLPMRVLFHDVDAFRYSRKARKLHLNPEIAARPLDSNRE